MSFSISFVLLSIVALWQTAILILFMPAIREAILETVKACRAPRTRSPSTSHIIHFDL